ncbi:hypothetical protein ES677_01885 [Bizionia gelidisalsuginis]|uniref:Lipoprotein n=1 Tax=Bizionia gelidisalsuginis TaxID=291188 RepID=A0ABY3MEW3_9FLAO|nr:hypothetical protein [Bizionia gelidisalsuginis]TYC18154.1 hypothetical protein ES677_01885 [Bizionia gelidisalsuginis]
MKTLILLLTLIVLCLSCSSQKRNSKKNNFEIFDSITFKFNKTDSLLVHEMAFTPKYEATDLQRFMFSTYGKWNNTIQTEDKLRYLVWKNIKLLDHKDALFTVAVGGKDKKTELLKVNGKPKYGRIFYCSAIVFNVNNYDCFKPESLLKEALANYFINGVKTNKKGNKEFEKEIKIDY